MVLNLLIITCITCIGIIYFFSNRDILSPSMLLCIGYLIAGISCAMNVDEWEVSLHWNTYIILFTGIVAFCLPEIYMYIISKISSIYRKNNRKLINSIILENSIINISNLKIIVCCLFNILVAYLYLLEIIRISGGYHGSFSKMMNIYRSAYSYENVALKSYVIQLSKISKGIGYTFLFVFINNVFATNRLKGNWKYIFPTILFLLMTFLKGGRLNIIAFCMAIIFLIYFNWNKKYHWKKVVNGKVIKVALIIFFAFILVFYGTKSLVGRQSKRNLVDYITTYFGGSIQLLDEYLNSFIVVKENSNETFPGIIQSLNKLKFTNISIRKSLEFRHVVDGAYLGNIYTGLRRYYNDFGYLGLILIQMIYSIFFNILYRKIRKIKDYSYSKIFMIIFYSYNLFALITQAMEDHFFIDLSLGLMFEMLIVYITIRIIINSNDAKVELERKNDEF